MAKLAEILGTITYGGECAFTPTIVVHQQRADTGAGLPVSFDVDLDYDDSKYVAITAPARRTRPRVVWNGADLVLGRVGDVSFSFSMKTGEFQTMDFHTIGPLWSMPTVDPDPIEFDPCPPTPPVAPSGRSPFAWGNKPVELYLGFASGYPIKEIKVFKGWTLQKSNAKDTGIEGAFSAVDDSLLFAKKPLCLQIPPFAGYHRGEIVKLAAANVGMDPDDVICPLGALVTKPILLSNASLLPFIEELGRPENWWAYFSPEGKLVVEDVELKDSPDWVLDASKGDYVYDSLTETLPSQPPTSYYVTGSITVKDGEDDVVTTITTEEIREFYAPETVKVPTSGSSYLYADGSYRSIPVQQLMLVSRTVTRSTKKRGVEIRHSVERWGFYNPLAKDPNFDNYPTGTIGFNHAYGDQTFHRDETESFMLVSEEVAESLVDSEGTLQKRITTKSGWRSPRHAIEWVFPTKHENPLSRVGVAYMYPGPTFRVDTFEKYGLTERTTVDYLYGADGTQSDENTSIEKFFAPPSRCDVVDADPDTPPVPGPIAPPPRPTPWGPSLMGPTRVRNTFYFDVDVSTAPPGSSGTVVAINSAPSGLVSLQGTISPVFGSNVTSNMNFGPTLPTRGTIFVYSSLTTKPAGFAFAQLQVAATGGHYSNLLRFDPWAGLPAGADISRI